MIEDILVRRGVAPVGSGLATMLLPVDPRDDAILAGIALGETVAIKLVRVRSLPHHRLFFGILDHVARSSQFETAERLLVALKIRLGRYDLLKMPNGKMVPVPQSISFAKMDQADFAKFFDDALRLICAEVIPGTERDDLVRDVETMLGISVSAEDLVEAHRRMEAGVPMPVAPTPQREPEFEPTTKRLRQQRKIEPNPPVQDAEPQRRAGAEQPAHIRRPEPWNATTNHCPHCPKQPNEFCDFICSSQQPDPAHPASESPQAPKAPIIAPGGNKLLLDPMESEIVRLLHERLEKQ